jgi:hypothetical protein
MNAILITVLLFEAALAGALVLLTLTGVMFLSLIGVAQGLGKGAKNG